MAFKMKPSSFKQGIASVKAEEDKIKDVSTETRKVGGRHTEIHKGKTVKPSYRDKMKQIERHLKEFEEGGATKAEVKAERERLVNDLKKHVGK
jgi:hypothetical protein|tara:strand:+ start:637 stop:915 length:279 start_codon:yes stop_codon:yes gene_type:complete